MVMEGRHALGYQQLKLGLSYPPLDAFKCIARFLRIGI